MTTVARGIDIVGACQQQIRSNREGWSNILGDQFVVIFIDPVRDQDPYKGACLLPLLLLKVFFRKLAVRLLSFFKFLLFCLGIIRNQFIRLGPWRGVRELVDLRHSKYYRVKSRSFTWFACISWVTKCVRKKESCKLKWPEGCDITSCYFERDGAVRDKSISKAKRLND